MANKMTACIWAIETQKVVKNITERHGACLDLLGDPSDRIEVVNVAQTNKSGTDQDAPEHIERRNNGEAIEAYIDYEADTALSKAIRDALDGTP